MERLIRIRAVALYTYRETIRNKILLNMLGFAVVLFGLAWMVSSWSLGEPLKILADLGLSITALIGVFIAVFAGIVLVYTEVERGTILPILAKPLPRWEYIVGKFVGFAAAALLVYAGMSVLLLLQLALMGRFPNYQLVAAIYLAGWEVLLITALAVMFSSFTSPAVSALATMMLFVSGRFSWDIQVFINHHPDTSVRPLLQAVYAIIPHLSFFNIRYIAVHNLSLP
ncbi:MAG: ABC transporter permease subunit, partial [Calditrichota bacterium]